MAELVFSDSRLLVPEEDPEPWPTLGEQVCEWMEAHLVHGPGDVLGQPFRLLDEYALFLYKVYEVFPHGHREAGRRRWKRAVLSRRKGMAKTELGAAIAIAEMDPTSPVRCVGWRKVRSSWVPVGGPVRDPYIPIVAYTEEQADELGYWSAHEMLSHCELGNAYDIGLERIQHRSEPGRMQALAAAPSARDGARTTFQWFDETHLYVSDRHHRVHSTMQRNIPKRIKADAWTLETTTMYDPAEGSVAQAAHNYALDIAAGRIKDPRMLFDHRAASKAHDLSTRRGLRAAIVEASGDAIEFTDVGAVIALHDDPQTDEASFRRYWLNQRVKGSTRWLNGDMIRARGRKRRIREGSRIVVGFDGSYNRDSTALVGCTVEAHPHLFVLGKWLRPADARPTWRVSRNDVVERVEWVMEHFDVAELAPDPHGWGREIEDWEQAYEGTVVVFNTDQFSRMGPAADDFTQGLVDEEFTIEPDEDLFQHFENCVPVDRRGYTVPTKSEPDSPDKIDLAVASVVAYHRARWWWAQADEGEEFAFVINPAEIAQKAREEREKEKTR